MKKALLKAKTLQLMWREYNEKYFSNLLEDISIRLTRSRRYYGLFRHADNSGNKVIRISGVLNKDPETLKDTLLHEMIHQFLYEQTGNLDSDHGEAFQMVAKDVGVNYDGIPRCVLFDCERPDKPSSDLLRHEAEATGPGDAGTTSD